MPQQPIYNFSAGPTALPKPVMERAQAEFSDWKGKGFSVMEISHRGKDFLEMVAQAESDLRQLLEIPNNYKVLYMQGGATGQFSFIPMNLLGDKNSADYIQTGQWSSKAIECAKRYTAVNIAAETTERRVPKFDTWQLDKDAAYVHITANETIDGIEFHDIPNTGDVPLIADMSSNILSKPVDVAKYGLMYASTQKNIAMAGLTLVIIREDLLGKAAKITPAIFNYQELAKAESMLNTPATYVWYMAGLTYRWLLEEGGLSVMAEKNKAKAAKLYKAIDDSALFENHVSPCCRSLMNVPFTLPSEELNERFLKEADKVGLLYLKGHRLVGGMRASIYNAMPEEGINALIQFMAEFERRA